MSEGLVEGRDAAGWHLQWQAMKAENDILNPKVDSLSALLAEAQNKLNESLSLNDKRLKEIEGLSAEMGNLQGQNASLRSGLDAAIKSATDAAGRVEILTHQLGKCFEALAPLHAALGEYLKGNLTGNPIA